MIRYALAMLLTTACIQEAKTTQPTDNSGFAVSLLFTHEGCKAYRFADGANYKYYVVCDNRVTTSSQESCGKGCTRTIEIETIK